MAVREQVLVIDPDELFRAILTELFTDEGYAAQAVPDGPTALERLRASPPGVILLEERLPLMSAVTVLRHCREDLGPHVPVVLMSTYPGTRDGVDPATVFGVLVKPFDLDVLLDLVKHALHTGTAPVPPLTKRTSCTSPPVWLTPASTEVLTPGLPSPMSPLPTGTAQMPGGTQRVGEDTPPTQALARLQEQVQALRAVTAQARIKLHRLRDRADHGSLSADDLTRIRTLDAIVQHLQKQLLAIRSELTMPHRPN